MNALVNSQLQALNKLKASYERRTGERFPVTFARYTGETKGEDPRALQTHPPQIVLTNYVMAVRKSKLAGREVWRICVLGFVLD